VVDWGAKIYLSLDLNEYIFFNRGA